RRRSRAHRPRRSGRTERSDPNLRFHDRQARERRLRPRQLGAGENAARPTSDSERIAVSLEMRSRTASGDSPMTALTLQETESIPAAPLDRPFRTLPASVEGETQGARYEIAGATGGPIIAILGGISASRHVTSSVSDQRAGWWEDVVGDNCAIDTRR